MDDDYEEAAMMLMEGQQLIRDLEEREAQQDVLIEQYRQISNTETELIRTLEQTVENCNEIHRNDLTIGGLLSQLIETHRNDKTHEKNDEIIKILNEKARLLEQTIAIYEEAEAKQQQSETGSDNIKNRLRKRKSPAVTETPKKTKKNEKTKKDKKSKI